MRSGCPRGGRGGGDGKAEGQTSRFSVPFSKDENFPLLFSHWSSKQDFLLGENRRFNTILKKKMSDNHWASDWDNLSFYRWTNKRAKQSFSQSHSVKIIVSLRWKYPWGSSVFTHTGPQILWFWELMVYRISPIFLVLRKHVLIISKHLLFYSCRSQVELKSFFPPENTSHIWRPLTCPWWLSDKGPFRQCRRHRFDPWVGKIPWERKWQCIPVFLLGSPMDRGAWRATVHGVAKSWAWLSN